MAILGGWSGVLKFFNYVQRSRPSFTYLLLNGSEGQYLFPRSCIVLQWNAFSERVKDTRNPVSGTGQLNLKKKKVFIPRITLLSENDEMSVVTLEMADKIAKRRNLKLVKIVDLDTRTERPIYKLMSTKDYLQEGLIRKKVKKLAKETSLRGEKMLSISSKINDHDLQTKLKTLIKFLNKRHEVRFVISFEGDKDKGTEICTQLETALKDVPVKVTKVTTHSKIKMNICPNLEETLNKNLEPHDLKLEANESEEKLPVDGDLKTEAKQTKNEPSVAPGS